MGDALYTFERRAAAYHQHRHTAPIEMATIPPEIQCLIATRVGLYGSAADAAAARRVSRLWRAEVNAAIPAGWLVPALRRAPYGQRPYWTYPPASRGDRVSALEFVVRRLEARGAISDEDLAAISSLLCRVVCEVGDLALLGRACALLHRRQLVAAGALAEWMPPAIPDADGRLMSVGLDCCLKAAFNNPCLEIAAHLLGLAGGVGVNNPPAKGGRLWAPKDSPVFAITALNATCRPTPEGLRLLCEGLRITKPEWFAIMRNSPLGFPSGSNHATLRWLAIRLEVTAPEARARGNQWFYQACQIGARDTARWIHDEFGLGPGAPGGFPSWKGAVDAGRYGTAFQLACTEGHLEVAQWLCADPVRLGVLVDHGDRLELLACACQSNNVDLAAFVYETLEIDPDDVAGFATVFIRDIAAVGSLRALQWFHATFGVDEGICPTEALGAALDLGHTEAHQWLVDTYAFTAAAVHQNGCEILNRQIRYGHLEGVQLVVETFGLSAANVADVRARLIWALDPPAAVRAGWNDRVPPRLAAAGRWLLDWMAARGLADAADYPAR